VLVAGYDGPGDLPDGTAYQGANQAAGAATLLEIARSWRERDFQPARPVLFVFCGAEFADGAGLRAFLSQPTMPLTDTVGLLEIGRIGAGNGFYLIGEGERRRDAELIHQLTNSAAVLERRFSFEATKIESPTRADLPRMWLHWDGSETSVGYPEDNVAALEEEKMRSAAETISLAAMMLSKVEYP
jgi:Zn-dependent M28 family amino/carboxypeptidase